MISRGFTIEVVTSKAPDATIIASLGNVSFPIYPALRALPTSVISSGDNPDPSWIAQYVDSPGFLGWVFGLNIANFDDEKFRVVLSRAWSLAPKTTYVNDVTAYINLGYYIRFRNSSGWYMCTTNPFTATSGSSSMSLFNPWGMGKGNAPFGFNVLAYYTGSVPYRYTLGMYAGLIIDQMPGGVVSVGAKYSGVLIDASSVPDTNTNYTHQSYRISARSNVSDGLLEFINSTAPFPPEPPEDDDPYSDLPTPGSDPLPGGGSVTIPGFPGLTATSAGVIGLFCPSVAQMQQLADFMWTDFGGTGSTIEEILKEIVEALKRTISSPLDYIVGLNIIPSQGLSIGASKVVRFGFVSSGVSMPLLANQYFTVDCGSIAFDTVCGNTFLDYAPYSKFSIYLPYIGFKDVDPNDFVGHTIGVVYHGDCVTGGITAYITKDGSVMYQYSGCCALNVPLSADSWGETISGAISVATGIVAAAATGGAAGVAVAAAKGAASVAANPSLLSPQVNHSGAVSGGAGCMGVQYPFVVREAVNFHSTAGFNKESGYPAYYYKALSEVTGFTTVLDPHINNIPQATQGEMSEIISLLESGVIL